MRCPDDSKERHRSGEHTNVFSKEVPAGIVLGVSASWVVNALLCKEQVSWQEALRVELRVSFGKMAVVPYLRIVSW